ncbi:MAG: tRNA dihydrouridine(20/20a) synthase DusA [Litoreibacter sp.]|uniref:tRNA dihydrouridine(20/20a) synthase DusA n=1 Tax=Litoreibacter sp. TaxID=1969459 RepID=UPI003299ED4E
MPNSNPQKNARLSVAPMMDWTDRHCRYFHRLISQNALLYTEMVTAPALVRGGAVHLLNYSEAEHPVAVQLGGSDPDELAEASRMCAERGYDEINLNVGCPSDRVQSGFFGAVLMENAPLVAKCVAAMIKAQPVEVTVKCRIGVDDQDPKVILPDFLSRVRDAGVSRVTIHARKAWLQGLSPKENRDIPPLDYDIVHQMKAAFPDIHISLNGGLDTLEAGLPHLDKLDGLMYGRAAYHQPWDILRDVDELVFGAAPQAKTRVDVVHEMLPYIEAHVEGGGKLGQVARHMLGIFAGQPGARGWRRTLSDGAHREGAGRALVLQALEAVQHVPETT